MEKMENIQLGLNTKKKFTIDGDSNKVLEIDVQDMSIMSRIKPAMEKLNNIREHWQGLQDKDKDNLTEEEIEEISEAMQISEKEMCDSIDFLFDTNVCEVCLGNASVFTPVNGRLKYEILITALSALYENTIKLEMSKFDIQKVKKRTSKYTKHPAKK